MHMKKECNFCLGTRRNQPSQTVTEIIVQRGEPYVNMRRSVWPSVRPPLPLSPAIVSQYVWENYFLN